MFATPFQHEAVRRAIEEVFRDPAFARGLHATHGPSEGLGALLVRAALHAFHRVLEWFSRLHDRAPGLYWVAVVLLFAVLLLLLAHIAWSVASALRGQRRARVDPERAPVPARVRRSRALHEDARRLAAEGRLGEATRRLLLAMLALFEERNLLRFAQGWTNREIFARLGAGPGLATRLDDFARAVDRAAYGGGAPSPEEFDRLDGVLSGVEAEALSGPRAGAGR